MVAQMLTFWDRFFKESPLLLEQTRLTLWNRPVLGFFTGQTPLDKPEESFPREPCECPRRSSHVQRVPR